MRNLSVGLLIFMAGWGVAWISFHHLQKDPADSSQSVIALPASPLIPDLSLPQVTLEDSQVDSIDSLLQRDDFETAIERYELLQAQSDDEVTAQTRMKILFHARHLVEQSRFSSAKSLLQSFLVAAFRDVEASLLLADVYLGEQDFSAALGQLYEVRAYAYRPLMLQKINSRIRSAVEKRVSFLKGNNEQNALLALYQYLTQQEPEHAPWFIGLAASQLALQDRESARSSLLLVAQDPGVGAQAQLMLKELTIVTTPIVDTEPQESITGVAGIPLNRKGHHFIVDASTAGIRNIRLLIDTGATLTMLSPDIFQQPGIEYTDTGRIGTFNTANGPVRAPVYILDSLKIGGWQVNRLEVGVLGLHGDPGIDGLLGMNFLRHFQFFIDQNEDLLRLTSQ